ncbi:COX15/CtaA family protein [Sphingomonas jatrophae]|uniref:Heme A synthase n=1 Tax=Sphingomonas jatrophae TaxID=1166337 RepID=A0A1I6LLG3_9SPHN|nr:COX15/CtaA family protein [Sphingomonas jatrophae]SFS04296.1 cytochrome c oxidase assembly protein subunit 15 [Sphingomonas jatrophae]
MRPAPAPRPLSLARWLLIVAGLVFVMLVVGGITRLTESGLSITSWKPVTGTIPPLTQAQWLAEFDAYKRIPEYQTFNQGMTLEGFKRIFFWEYLHRLIGRVIGLAFALPLAWYWWRRAIPQGYGPRLVALLALGGLQGAIGWWMVKSGLSVRTDVSHVRLAVHLLTALVTLGGLVWTALDLRGLAKAGRRPAKLRPMAAAVLLVLFVQLLFGAFTAGLDAGYAFSSWPLMGDALFPAGGWQADWPLLTNLVDNPVAVQFVHRWWAWLTAAAALALAWRAGRAGAAWALPAVAVVVGLQILLGILTLLLGVPIVLAAAHQAVAALLLALLVAVAHRLGRR